jgi:hypothetical protein
VGKVFSRAVWVKCNGKGLRIFNGLKGKLTMWLFVLAVIFALIGIFFLFVDFLSHAADTKGWGMFFIIISAATCLLKYYLANPEPVNGFFRSILSK